MEKFKKLGINEHILKSIKDLGFKEPTEIQEKTIPLVLEGKDIIAGASTGSGKTLAFACGVIENSKSGFGVQGLILTPTRELAEQITRELRKFSKNKKLEIIAVYGGMSMLRQTEELREADIVVGTPGRILDHLARRTLHLESVKTLVIDEADRMFDMGFKYDVEKIIKQCPAKKQTLLYSATISQDIIMLTKRFMNKPVEVSAQQQVDPLKLSQVYYDVEDGLKYSLLKHLLENEKSGLVMVFCNTRRNVDFVANNLKLMGIEALPIHGGFSQDKRNRIMNMFHSSKIQVMVCTDVAARGLDIKGVSHIYNYDIPRDAKEYVHRIGRTARAGEEGKVINIIASRDYENFSAVLKHYSEFKIVHEETPMIQRVRIGWMDEGRNGGRDSGRSFGGRSEGRRDNRSSDRRPSSGYRGSGNRSSYGRSEGRSSDRGSDRRSSSGYRRDNSRSSYGRSEGRRDTNPRNRYNPHNRRF